MGIFLGVHTVMLPSLGVHTMMPLFLDDLRLMLLFLDVHRLKLKSTGDLLLMLRFPGDLRLMLPFHDAIRWTPSQDVIPQIQYLGALHSRPATSLLHRVRFPKFGSMTTKMADRMILMHHGSAHCRLPVRDRIRHEHSMLVVASRSNPRTRL